ncbi:hypothetical protein C7459_1357 [Tumebacillus permanentifrigoris]|uniref:Uncharacterized protein n=1 Tax=Tumebacillus permanentifrigoris TaxID=378543 RepID=A0A316D266_9BACL|nr:hypothetical protein C7459_1357 [Tumebacillus permanentifrigoris]
MSTGRFSFLHSPHLSRRQGLSYQRSNRLSNQFLDKHNSNETKKQESAYLAASPAFLVT